MSNETMTPQRKLALTNVIQSTINKVRSEIQNIEVQKSITDHQKNEIENEIYLLEYPSKYNQIDRKNKLDVQKTKLETIRLKYFLSEHQFIEKSLYLYRLSIVLDIVNSGNALDQLYQKYLETLVQEQQVYLQNEMKVIRQKLLINNQIQNLQREEEDQYRDHLVHLQKALTLLNSKTRYLEQYENLKELSIGNLMNESAETILEDIAGKKHSQNKA